MGFVLLVPMLAAAQARVDFGQCRQAAFAKISEAGGDDVSFRSDQPWFRIDEQGKISVQEFIKDKLVKKEVTQDRETYAFKVDLGLGISEIRQLEVKKEKDRISVRHIFDPEAQDKANAAYAKKEKLSVSRLPQQIVAQESIYRGGESCELTQESTTLRSSLNKKELAKSFVNYDADFCRSAGEVMKKHGKDKVEQCSGLLTAMLKVYDERDSELSKDGKTLRDPFMSAAFGGGVPSPVGALLALDQCYPQSWSESEVSSASAAPAGQN